jgi:hypothetical protein
MKIKSNLEFNTSVLARHTKLDKDATSVVIGGSMPEYLLIPAGSTIELPDAQWVKFAEAAKQLIKNEHLTLVEAPVLSEAEYEAEKAKQLKSALAMVEKLSPKKVVSK